MRGFGRGDAVWRGAGGVGGIAGEQTWGYTARVEALFREVQTPAQAQAVLTGRLRRGEDIPGFHLNDQWRICFVWTDAGPTEVEIVDYH